MKQKVLILFVVVALFGLLFGPFLFAAFSNELPAGVNDSPTEVRQQVMTTKDAISFTWLTDLGMPALTGVLVFAVGYFIRRLRDIPNYCLAVLLPAGTWFYYHVGESASDIASKNTALKCAYGLIISIVSVLAVIVAHDKVIAWAATKFPMLSILVSDPKPEEKPKV